MRVRVKQRDVHREVAAGRLKSRFTWTGCYLGPNAGAASLNPAWNRTSSFC